jgi:hypothetical protein
LLNSIVISGIAYSLIMAEYGVVLAVITVAAIAAHLAVAALAACVAFAQRQSL